MFPFSDVRFRRQSVPWTDQRCKRVRERDEVFRRSAAATLVLRISRHTFQTRSDPGLIRVQACLMLSGNRGALMRAVLV